MGFLCFVLDLPSLQPLLLNDIKRSLLRLENLCVSRKLKLPYCASTSPPINIAILCIERNNASEGYELRVIYKPSEQSTMREYHHTVNSLSPSLKSMSSACGQVSCLGPIFAKEGLLSWGTRSSCKKVVMISSLFLEKTDSFREILFEAADNCISVDFIQVHEHTGIENSSLPDLAVNIGEFENCTFHQVPWDIWQFMSFEKRWFQDIISDVEGPIEVTLLFEGKLYKDKHKVFCSLYPSVMHLSDNIQPCQSCRCHGLILDNDPKEHRDSTKPLLCPQTGQALDNHDCISNGVKIGSETTLYLPSLKSLPESDKLSFRTRPGLTLTILNRVMLSTMNEGLLFGDPYILVPSTEVDLDNVDDNLDMNDSVFASLCQSLYSQDCGLLCSSTTDLDAMVNKSFPCYYLLLPVESRSITLRRIAASEEFLLLSPDPRNNCIPSEIQDSVDSCLLKMGMETYNPLNHERGLHPKLNWLAKESSQLRRISANQMHAQEPARSSLRPKQGNYMRTENTIVESLPLRQRENNYVTIENTGEESLSLRQKENNHARTENTEPGRIVCQDMHHPVKSFSGIALSQATGSMGQIPLQTFKRTSINRMPNVPSAQKQNEMRKTNKEPVLKSNFRRIKQGKI